MESFINQKFNLLTVTSFAYFKEVANGVGRNPTTLAYFECLCECGNTTIVSIKNIRKGLVKSCGCLRAIRQEESRDDLTGRRYGKLKVVAKSDKGGRYWDCVCDCGNTLTTLSGSLKTGATGSCGCIRREVARTTLLGHIQKLREDAGLPPDSKLSSDNKLERMKFIPLSKEIYQRDNNQCLWCSADGCKLNAHHLEKWVTTPERRFDRTNLVTLCEDCHNKIHRNNNFGNPDPIMTILLSGYSCLVEEGFFDDDFL